MLLADYTLKMVGVSNFYSFKESEKKQKTGIVSVSPVGCRLELIMGKLADNEIFNKQQFKPNKTKSQT